MKPFALAAVAAGCVAMSACATVTPTHVVASAGVRDHIASTEVVAPVKQNEIYVFVPQSNVGTATGGGLIGALIDTGVNQVRSHRAEESSAGLRDAVIDYSFDNTLRSDLQQALTKVSWLKVSGARVIKDDQPASLDKAISDSKSSAVLVADTDYHLSNDGSTLAVTLQAALYPNSPALAAFKGPREDAKVKSAPVNALYRNTFVYTTPVAGGAKSREVNMPIWSANHGAALRQALDTSVAALSHQLADDLGGVSLTADAGQIPVRQR